MMPKFVSVSGQAWFRLAVACLALVASARAAVNATFNSATDVIVTANSFSAAGDTVNLALNFAPQTGAELTIVRNTGLGFITGTFSNLAQGQLVSLPFNGTTYKFVANYFGGSGNDLVLMWANNRAYAWGFSSSLGGDGSRNLPVPVDTDGPLAGKTITAIATGFSHSLALCSDGTLVAWGSNREGQIGDNSTSFRFYPVLVNTGSALAGKTVVAVSAGISHSLALCSDGTVVAWGKNEFGEVGDGTTTRRLTPVAVSRSGSSALAGKTVVAIKAGARHSLALCSDGTVAAWGMNANAQLGDNTVDNRSVPVKVNNASGVSALAGKTVVALAAGNYHSMALCSDGSVAAWGNNNEGQLGQANPVTTTTENITIVKSTYTLFGQPQGFVQEIPGIRTTYTEISERRVPGLVRTSGDISALYNKTVVAIHAGVSQSYALCSDGTIAAWGDNTSGKLGDGTNTKRPMPTAVSRTSGSALANKTSVALAGGRHFATALNSDGTVAAWGENEDGQLGDDTTTERRRAVAVGMSTLGFGEAFVRIAGTSESFHTVAIVAVPILPEMSISGNGTTIASGKLSTGTADHTDFGLSTLGSSVTRTFTIKNDGPAALHLTGAPVVALGGANAAGFTVSTPPGITLIPSGSSTTFAITYSPTQVGQRSTATVSIANNDPRRAPYTFQVQGAGPVPDIAVFGNGIAIPPASAKASPVDHTDFGTAALGAGISRTFTVKNDGLGPLTLTGSPKVALSGADAADFAVTQQPGSPVANGGGTTTFQITYTPAVAGKRSNATVSIASDDTTKTPFTFAIAGTGPVPDLFVAGNGVNIARGSTTPALADHTDFGVTTIGAAIVRTFTVRNDGLGPLSLTGTPKVVIAGTHAAEFAVTQAPDATVAASGGTTTFQVSFTPAANGVRNASVSIVSSDAAKSPYTFAITGSGPSPDISVLGNGAVIARGATTPSTSDHTDFGTTAMADAIVRTFTIRNNGQGVMTLNGSPKVAISGAGAAQFSVVQQPASTVAIGGGTTTFQVSYTPSAIGVTNAATLTIASDDPRKPSYAFAIRGRGPLPVMAVSGNAVAIVHGSVIPNTADATDFGQTASGTPVARTFTIRNDGLTDLTLSGDPVVSIAGAQADFTVTQAPATTVAPGATTTFQLTFNPVTTALRAAKVSIASNDPAANPFTFAINGKGPDPVIVGGSPFMWGWGSVGQLGNGTKNAKASAPVCVDASGALKGKSVTALTSGIFTVLALTSDGKLYTWGTDSEGSMGTGGVSSTVPIAVDMTGVLAGKTVTAIAGGNEFYLVLTSDGKLYTWGTNLWGQLGNGTNVSSSVPIAVDMTGALNGKTVTAIAANYGACAALTSDGKLYTWGNNQTGQLGDGTFTDRKVPTAVVATGSSSLNGRVVTGISAGSGMLALTSDNKLHSWGEAVMLGRGVTNEHSSIPVAVDMTGVLAGKTITAISAGVGHALVLTSQGKIYAWGRNDEGQLGNNSTTLAWSPVAVDMTGVLNGKVVSGISAAFRRNVVITSDGGAYTWGTELRGGELGVADLSSSRVPVKVQAGALNDGIAVGLIQSNNRTDVVGVIAKVPQPVATGETYAVSEDRTLNVAAVSGVLTNDSGCCLAAFVAKSPANGTLSLNAAGSFVYIPAANFFGTDTFAYEATGGNATSVPTLVTITVNAVNDAPSLTLAATALTVYSNDGAYAGGAEFATFSPGPANEADQTLVGYTVTNSNNALFSVQPAVSSTGVLTFTPAATARGTATVTVVAQDSGGTANSGVDTVTKTFTITVRAPNSAPSATFASANITLAQGSGAYTAGAGFATFSPGPAADAGQTLLGYTVTNDNSALFSVPPALGPTGTLTFTLAAGQSGSATVTVVVQDNGGTANGGVDRATAVFKITVTPPSSTPANQAPTLVLASTALNVAQNSGAQSTAGFATFSPGPAGESWQTLVGYAVSSTNSALFSALPAIGSTGTLTFTPANNARGSATVTVTAQDNGGTANGGVDTVTKSFTITVAALNVAPTLVFSTQKVVAQRNAPAHSISGFATFSPGPDSESAQTLLGYTVTNDNPALFGAQPALSPTGVLTFAPAADTTGVATVTVIARDSGGTAGGGVDAVTKTFVIEVKNPAGLFVVTNTNDSGPGSLRQAILDANASGVAATILVQNGLGALAPTPPLPAITTTVGLNPGAGNTLDGALIVGAGGVLNLDGTTLLNGDVLVQAGGTLAGSGEIGGELIVDAGGILAPGASPGVYRAGKATWRAGGVYTFEINDALGEAGVASDLLTLKDTLTIQSTPENSFTIKVATLSGTTAGAMANFDPTVEWSWPIVRLLNPAAGQPTAIDSRIRGFVGENFNIDTTGFANPTSGGRFSLYTTATELRLAFTPNNPPVPFDDTYNVDQDDTLTVAKAQGLLANDIDADFSPVSTLVVTTTPNGTLVLNANGSFTYTPVAGFYGTDSFIYRSTDGSANSPRNGTANITVHARPVNTVPAAQYLFRNNVLRFSAATLPAANAVRVADPDSTSVTVALSVGHGTLAITSTTGLTLPQGATGASLTLTGALADVNAALESLAYSPATDYVGDDTLSIVSTDEGSRASRGNGSVAITIAPPVTITSGLAATTTYKSAFQSTVTATGLGVTFSATGLPAGLTLDTATGLISGAAAESGTFNVALTATDAGNYTATATLVLTVERVNLTITGVVAPARVYDATTAAPLNFSAAALVGIVDGDDVKLVSANATGSFADKLVGAGKTVTIAGLALGGQRAAHYTFTVPSATSTITAKALTVAGVVVSDRGYDGTSTAALNLTNAALVGVAGSDRVSLVTTGATGSFADANAGNAKPITVTGLSLTGEDAANYTLTPPTPTASIARASAGVTISSLSHVYDGSAKVATVTVTPGLSVNTTYSPSPVVDAGSYTVSANVTDPNYVGSASATLTIAKASQTVTLSVPGTATLEAPVGVSASASSGLPVTLTVSGPATLEGTQLVFNGPGTATVTATQPGNNNFAAATATATVTVAGKLAQTIAFAAPADRLSNSGAFALSATATSGLPVSFAVLSGPAMLSGSTVTLTGTAGQVVVRASQPGNGVYAAAPDVTASFTVTAATLNVFFGSLTASGNPAKAGDVAATLPPSSNQGNLLVVAPGVGLNTMLDFTLRPDGTFTHTLVIDAPAAGSSDGAAPARSGAPMTLTVRGSLANGRLSGVIEPLGLTFSASILPVAGPSANAAGFYKSSTLANAQGSTYSVVGTNNEVLVLAQTADVTTGGMTTLKPDGTFGLQLNTAAGLATIRGAVDEPTTTVAGTISLPGRPDTSFAGVVVTTTRTDRLINLSSRVRIGGGDRVLITGFVIGGNEPKQILVRGVGPALAGFGVQGALANPRVRIYRGSELVAENDNWSATAGDVFARVGAFTLAPNSNDAALLATLPPGAYTAQVLDGGSTGVALAEIYDASVNPNSEYQRLVNISTRGEAGSGENVLIGGFIVTGNAPKRLLVRGIGPGLAAFGVSGTLADPRLRVYRGGEVLAENDNWSAVAADATAVADAGRVTGAFALEAGSRDAALILTLAPGAYTAQVGAVDGTSTGVALVEIYELPE